MKKLFLHIVLMSIVIFGSSAAFSQYSIDNTGGRLNNSGTIKVKTGQVRAFPDTIGGRVEFLQTNYATQQEIPNIVYNQLVLKNTAKKLIRDYKDVGNNVKSLTVRDSLIIEDSAEFTTRWIGWNPQDVLATSTVKNTARYEGPRDVVLINENVSQDLLGNGSFSNLKIDNPNGVNIKGSGGFRVNEKLTLARGTLRNDAGNNLTAGDTSLIIRTADGSLQSAPKFEQRVNVTYTGDARNIATGPEIPDDSTVLQALHVENTGGITLMKSITVNEGLYLNSDINTEPDTLNKHILSYRGTANPVFENPNAEVNGSIKRSFLGIGDTLLFNNRYTFALFPDAASLNGAKTLTFRIKPRTFPQFVLGSTKVMRNIHLEARDIDDILIQSGVTMTLGYGWRHIPADTALHETNNLNVPDIILQRYIDNNWSDFLQSMPPQLDTINGWGFSTCINVTPFGDFALGVPYHGTRLLLAAKVYLEGPYRHGSMAADLLAQNIIPLTPPDQYPYNLDPDRTNNTVLSIPDSVVDWVVVEFRKFSQFGTPLQYKTGFLKQDGSIVGLDGFSTVNINDSTSTDSVYIILRHRNHLSVVTVNPYAMYTDNHITNIDFTNPETIFGGTNSMKLIGIKDTNTFLFGMIAGDVNADGVIDDDDFISIWEQRDYIGYMRPEDTNLTGIITTSDFNVSWNNRNKKDFEH